MEMLSTIWVQFETEIVRHAFRGSGYFSEEVVDYSMEPTTESDSNE